MSANEHFIAYVTWLRIGALLRHSGIFIGPAPAKPLVAWQRRGLLVAMERFQEFTDALPGLLKGDSPNCEAPVEAIQIETTSNDYSDVRAFPGEIVWLAEATSAAELVRARRVWPRRGAGFFSLWSG